MRERLAFVRGGNVHERFDIVDDHADIDGNAAGRNQFAGDVVNQIVFVARRIIIAEQLDADVRAFARGGDGFDGVLLFAFDADDAFVRADGFHGELHSAHQFGGAFFHDDGVLVQERFAFRAVGDDGFSLGVEFDVRGESAAARADDAGQSDFFCQDSFLNFILGRVRHCPVASGATITSTPRARNLATSSGGAWLSVTIVSTMSSPHSGETDCRPNFVWSRQKIIFCAALQHRALDVNQQRVRIGDAFERDAAGAHDRHVGAHLGKCLDRHRPDQHAKPRINHAARQNHFHFVCRGKQICNRQRVRHDLRRLFFEMPRDVINRRACVENHALIRANQFGAGFADGFLFRKLMRVARGERKFVRSSV